MLSRELMGLVALGVLWVNGLLILAVALGQVRAVHRLRSRRLAARRRGELFEVQVTEARAGGPFARRRVHQVGRALTGRRESGILFTDGPQSFEVRGGRVSTSEGEVLEVEARKGPLVEIWGNEERHGEAAALSSPADYAAAAKPAATHRGYVREVDVEVREGDAVFVHASRDGDALVPPPEGPLLVSLVDPVADGARRARLGWAFVLGLSFALVSVTVLALWPPVFGTVSTIGAALGVALFLGAQPLGTAVRDRLRPPSHQPVGGLCRAPDESDGPQVRPGSHSPARGGGSGWGSS